MDGQTKLSSCPQCGEVFTAACGRPGRPQVWCSQQCRKDSWAARQAALRDARPVEVVTVATEKTTYTTVPLHELTKAITENPKLAIELAQSLQRIAETSYNYQTQKAIRDGLNAAGVATVTKEWQSLETRNRDLKDWRKSLEKRDRGRNQNTPRNPTKNGKKITSDETIYDP